MKNHQIKLIDSTYPVHDARDVLFSLINDKIEFLNQKIFSLQERFGSDTSHLEKRVKSLRAELQQLLDLLNTMNEDQLIDIHCEVDMKIRKPETV
jgi:hypothetical protein